jgi:hypothetical protein
LVPGADLSVVMLLPVSFFFTFLLIGEDHDVRLSCTDHGYLPGETGDIEAEEHNVEPELTMLEWLFCKI